jgi:diguanylate cyclase (GGDEF)-like protein
MQAHKSTTYWLTLISATLLLVFFGILYLQFHHSRLLSSTVQYSESTVSWNVFQLQSEALRFNSALSTSLLDPAALDRNYLQLRHDIFFSRVDTLAANETAEKLLANTEYKTVLASIYGFLDAIDPYFSMTPVKALAPQDIPQILKQLDPIQSRLNDLSLAAVHQSGLHAEYRAAEVQRQIAVSTGLILFQLLLTLLFFVIVIRQINQLQRSRSQLSNLANYDPLTHLPNRRLFRDRLEQEIRKAHRSQERLALLFIDLDNFKDINDTLGHDIGDLLLQEATERLVHSVRESDTVARLGGDEFTIILGNVDGTAHAAHVSESILQALTRPFELNGREVYVSACIGITFYPDDASNVNSLLKNADQAMYVAKGQGRSRFHYFTASMQEEAQAKMHLINDLRSAISHGEFRLYYQPIMEMATGRVRKAEALIRWKHPTRGLVSPLEFIPVAEETGLIIEIGNWVFEEAARQTLCWRERLHADFQLSINTSPAQLRADGSSLDHWQKNLRELGLPGEALAIEITEGLLMDASFANRLVDIHSLGIEVSLDDFGTGYSSMAYLKKFDVDYLKIDKSFVASLQQGSNEQAICEAMIVMAHKLGIKVIAEGIETDVQRALLESMRCDYGQGYLYSYPIPADGFEQLFEQPFKPPTRPNVVSDPGY